MPRNGDTMRYIRLCDMPSEILDRRGLPLLLASSFFPSPPPLSTRFYLDICPLHSFYIFALLVFQEYLETNQLEPVPSTRVKVLSRRLNNVITRLEIERSGAIFSRCILFSNNPWKYLPLPGLWIEVLIVLEKERKIILLMFHFSNTLAPDCAVLSTHRI